MFISLRMHCIFWLLLCSILPLTASAQPFQVKWPLDNSQAGTSSHANFSPQDATLLGGPNTYALASIYSPDGHGGNAYIVRPWPMAFSAGRYMEFKFSVNAFKYNITSLSFRLRRSPTGTSQVRLRTSADGFAADVGTFSLPGADIFYAFSAPVNYANLTAPTFSIRLYGYNATNATLGVLWLDDVTINGQVLPIVLPIHFTWLHASPNAMGIGLSWETAWEKNSDSFIIERSRDMLTFSPIATLPASGETAGRTQYEQLDPNPDPGINYYRLKLVDKDGSHALSYAVAAIFRPAGGLLLPAPNPASRHLIRLADTGIDAAGLQLCHAGGQPVAFRLGKSAEGFTDILPDHELTPGMYVLSLRQGENKEEVKVLVP